MSSNSVLTNSYLQIMEATGFYRNGAPTSGVIEATELRHNSQYLDKRIKYRAVIDPEQLNATAVFELSGSPCIYFTQLEQSDPNPQELTRLHHLSWNQGLAPMLWVVTPTKVLLYNCYSKPKEDDQKNLKKHLIELFEKTEQGLKKLNQYASRLQIESGEFWKWSKAKKIDRKQRVDEVLVKDLTDTEDILVTEKGLKRSVAQTLLIQSIFLAYLEDRGILKPQILQNNFGLDSLDKIFSNKSVTDALFNWTKETFNGDFFALSPEDMNLVESQHLEVVKTFIGGLQEVKTGQLRIWRAYDFKVIPVELISAIYEKFIYADNSKSAKDSSTHYTPLNLVDLVLSEIFRELDSNAKVLDLACGSGVFLVDALRRLVGKHLQRREQYSRKLIRDTLYNQIYGVDINQKAIQIAAFSLYLTALELEYELEQYPSSSELKFQKIIGKNLFASDAFDTSAEFNRVEPFLHKQFNAIVGNPPWTKSEASKSASKYCKLKRPEIGYPKGYPTAKGTPPDQAFLWRIGDFANTSTLIGLILGGKRFFSNESNAQEAKKALLTHFTPKVVINFSKLRREHLFPYSEAPAMILIAIANQAQPKDSFYLVCPERSVDFRQHGIIEIGTENIKKLSTYGVAHDSDMLKVATWGSARDLSLIQRLRTSYQKMEEVVGTEPKAGLKIGKSNQKYAPEYLYGKKILSTGVMHRYKINTDQLEDFGYEKVESPRDASIYKSPLIVVSEKVEDRGINSAFSSQDLVYTISYSGIPVSSECLAHYINAILNSSMASYFLFMTASSWGIERNKIMTQDLSRFPVPKLDSVNKDLLEQILELEAKLCEGQFDPSEEALKQDLNGLIFCLYDFDKTEQVLVEDANKFTIDLYMNREKSAALKKPNPNHLKEYASHLIGVIQLFLQTLNERTIVADVIDVGKAPLQIVKLSIVPVPRRNTIVQTVSGQQLETVLKSIAEQLPQQLADRIYTRRDLRIYAGEDIYIVKPAKQIYWTRSAGLNDADTILSEYLKTNHVTIR